MNDFQQGLLTRSAKFLKDVMSRPRAGFFVAPALPPPLSPSTLAIAPSNPSETADTCRHFFLDSSSRLLVG